MRITLLCFSILTTVGLLTVGAKSSVAQILDSRISIDLDTKNLYAALKKMEKEAHVVFAYDENDLQLKQQKMAPARFQNESLRDILNTLFGQAGISFREEAGNILLTKKMRKKATGKIRGKVTDENGDPLPGASILVAGTSMGTSADENGIYVLELDEDTYTLEVSYIGFSTREFKDIALKNGEDYTLDIKLTANALLQEVVVSYGIQKQREVTGSIAQVDAPALQSQPVGQFAQQLQGKVAGVQINQYSGQPGGRGVGFRIRGAASLFADNQPLIVIDGLPITGSINNINPAEIETITVLKDASSTSLYGSRAANGVILLTTRHAKPGESKIEFNAFYGVQKIPQNKVPKMMTAREFADFQNEYYQDKVKYENYTGTLDPVYQNPERYNRGTDWFKTLTQNAPMQKYDLIVSSARDKSSSTVIGSYQNQEGVIINTGTRLFSLRINQDLRIAHGRVKIGFNLAPSYRIDHNNRLTTDGVNGLFEKIVEASPLIEPVNADGTLPLYVNSPGMVANLNPYAQFTKTKDDYKTMRLLGNAYLNYEIVDGLTFKTNLAVDKGAESHNKFVPATIVANGIANGQSEYVDNYSWTAEANLQYAHTFFDDHNIEMLAGYSAQKFDQESNTLTGTNFPNDDVAWLKAATAISAGSSGTTHYALLSEIVRLNYNFRGKYLLSGAFRRDGSSRFGPNNKYGYFPSVSAGWIMSDEGFLQGVNGLDLLKIRASYGITGNNAIGNYTFIPNTGSDNYVFNKTLTSGITITSLGNKNLGWERNKQLDIGLDLAILNNRITFTYDYYHRLSDGLIQDMPIPRASGFTTIKSNVGVFKFWGHEFTLNTVNLSGKLRWTSNFNLSIDRNRIESLVNPGYLRRNNTTSSDYYRHQVGHSLGEFYGFVFEGLYKDQADLDSSPKLQIAGVTSNVGTIKMKDVTGDGFITNDDRTFIGNPTPKFTFGFTNDFQYKSFDLSITMTGAVGGKILNPSKWAYLTNLDGARMLLASAKDRWRSPEEPGSGVLPRTMAGTTALGRSVNSQWIENGTYLTVKNIALGYNLHFNNSLSLKSMRIYASVQQAFIFTNYSGMNPEINVGGMDPTLGVGIDENAYPVPRTFSIGLNTTLR
jgi:TonB-linked SusC/RagA family outer membrane protein